MSLPPDDPRERPAMREALRALTLPRKRPYPEDGRPATKGFAATKAQRIAVELHKKERRP